MLIYALIPMRKGSIRIKNKNFIKIKKKPLYLYSVEPAIKSKYISKVFISTNEDRKKFTYKNKKLEIIGRSRKSATKKAITEIVIREFLKKFYCDYLILIQVTNPFIKTEYIDLAIKKMIHNKKKYDSLLSVVKSKYMYWKKRGRLIYPENFSPRKIPRSQDIKDAEFIENGCFYIFRRNNFFKHKFRSHGKMTFFEMPKHTAVELDEKEDLEIIRKFI